MSTKPSPEIEHPDPTNMPDPYAESPVKPTFRLNVDVMTDDIMLIKSMVPSRGTVQHLISHYVKSLADEIRELGLYYSPENCLKFIDIVKRRNQFTSASAKPKRRSTKS